MRKKILNIAIVALVLCFSGAGFAQTAGTMTFTFTSPKHTTGNYETNGRYAMSVWIESCTACTTSGTLASTYVRTKLHYCCNGNTNDHIAKWSAKSGGSSTNATTGGTSTVFTSRTVTWDGMNAAQTALVADGSYRVVIEETWGHTTNTVTRYFPFTKGPASFTNTTDVANDTNFTGISLTWNPTLGTESFVEKPDAVVYPNPTKGIFNIDFKNNVKNINVVNILGAVVYNENIEDNATETSKKIDFSDMANGVYIINLSNDSGSSSYKIILDK